MHQLPKISIVTPTYNCGHLIQRCIESVTSQGYQNIEHIIVDGGSSDNTVQVLKRYPHLRWISEKDTGEANALNKGLTKVTGDIVCWLNADDYLHPNALIRVGQMFASNPEWELVFGNTHMVDPNGKILWVKNSFSGTSLNTLLKWWEHGSMPHQPSMFFRKRLFDRVGPLNETLHFSIDLELWLRCAVETRYHHIDRVLSCAVQRSDCKSDGTEVDQIQSHWRVLLPFLKHLSFDDRVDFWGDYYIGRLTGLNNHNHLDPVRFPDSEEALIAVVRAITLHESSLGILSYLFPEQQALLAVVERLIARGLYFNETQLIAVSEKPRAPQSIPVDKTIVIDGVFFERARTGIFRVWDSILREWSQTSFGKRVVVLDRSGHAPRHPGIRYRLVPRANKELIKESEMLKNICLEENAALFISTYYTSVDGIPSIMPVYDMIPEKTRLFKLTEPDWQAKHLAIKRASAFCCISESTRKDLLEVFPDINPMSAVVTLCGIDREKFSPAGRDELIEICKRLNLDRPYFIVPGGNVEYKNVRMFFEAMRAIPSQHGFKALTTGSFSQKDLGDLTTGCEIVNVGLTDDELRVSYTGALALVYPTKYEGFGLPILEAMSCGCPVITTPWTSIPEVAGGAAMYVKDASTLTTALVEIQRPEAREKLIAAGFERAGKFSWQTMASQIQGVCEQVIGATELARPVRLS